MFGKTTACSALNGCYSKVCQPIAALQLLVLPHNYSSDEVKILIEASSAKFAEIGICIAGGHTIIGEQLMLGFVILGKPCLK